MLLVLKFFICMAIKNVLFYPSLGSQPAWSELSSVYTLRPFLVELKGPNGMWQLNLDKLCAEQVLYPLYSLISTFVMYPKSSLFYILSFTYVKERIHNKCYSAFRMIYLNLPILLLLFIIKLLLFVSHWDKVLHDWVSVMQFYNTLHQCTFNSLH